jgi:hypothetical protein
MAEAKWKLPEHSKLGGFSMPMFNSRHLRSAVESCRRRPPQVTVISAAGSATATPDPVPASIPKQPAPPHRGPAHRRVTRRRAPGHRRSGRLPGRCGRGPSRPRARRRSGVQDSRTGAAALLQSAHSWSRAAGKLNADATARHHQVYGLIRSAFKMRGYASPY